MSEKVANGPDDPSQPDDPDVSLVFHQLEYTHGRMAGVSQAVLKATERSGTVKPPASSSTDFESSVKTAYTVVEALTPVESPDKSGEAALGSAQDAEPRSDEFMRCLRLVTDYVRAYRLQSGLGVALPHYERIPFPVLRFTAPGVREVYRQDQGPFSVLRPTAAWQGPQLVLLEHKNLADPLKGESLSDEQVSEFHQWMRYLRQGNPVVLWRERIIEADEAINGLGDRSGGVILANTATETLMDVILSLLLWEEGVDPKDAEKLFVEGKVLQRITRELSSRLGASWSTAEGPVGEWFEASYLLRHRIVHGAYWPTHPEAVRALRAAKDLHTFAFDRIAAKRNIYPRSTLITVARTGLKKRNLWGGKIKVFAEQNAPTESDWSVSFRDFFKEVSALRLARRSAA
ncbi:hypothetical protein J2X42_003662 [Arthrobacter sp. BE255]|nr:hypothetical protein [Arthrobacter sp. BE255]